jgi:AcrR family transcriptional regulator
MKDNNKRESILKSATECFARYGFDKTTLEDIGKRAGLNKTSLYYYFVNKEEIFMEVVLGETKKFMADLQAKTVAYPDIRKQIRFYLTERIRRYGEVIHLTRLSIDSLQKLEPLLDEVFREIKAGEMTFLTNLLRRAAQDSDLAINMPSADLAEHLYYLSDALKHDVVRTTGQFATEEIDFSPAISEVEFWTKLILR